MLHAHLAGISVGMSSRKYNVSVLRILNLRLDVCEASNFKVVLCLLFESCANAKLLTTISALLSAILRAVLFL